MMSDREHDSVGTGILPVLYGQARRLSHQAIVKLGMSPGDLNQTELLATAISGVSLSRCADVACSQVFSAGIDEHRLNLDANVFSKPAARVEAASGGGINRAGHVTFENDSPALGLWIGDRNSTEQSLSVWVDRPMV